MLKYFLFFSSFIFLKSEDDDILERDICMKIRHNTILKRDIPTLIGAGSSTTSDDDIEFDPKLVLHYNFENQDSFLHVNVQDSSPFENNGRFSPGGIVLKIPGSSCGNAAYLPASDIVINGETFQAKPTYGITISAWIMLLDIKGRHNIFETYGLTNPKGQFHFEVDYGILRWFHSNSNQGTVFEVAAELVPLKVWTHVSGTYNSTTGISQIYINGKATNRTYARGKISKDWSCLAHIGGQCKNKALMGFIDEIRIYNFALSSVEIRNLHSMCKFVSVKSNTDSFKDQVNNINIPDDVIKEEYFVRKNDIPSESNAEKSNEMTKKRTLNDKIENSKNQIFN